MSYEYFRGFERCSNIWQVFEVNNSSLISTLFDLIHVRKQTLHIPIYYQTDPSFCFDRFTSIEANIELSPEIIKIHYKKIYPNENI